MNRLLSKMVALRKKDQVGEEKVPKSPHKNPLEFGRFTEMNPIICHESIFAENCDESVDSCCVAEEMMEVAEGGGGLKEMPLNESQEDPEEKTDSPTIAVPKQLGETDLYMVLFCWFGLACTVVHAICTRNTCLCQICQVTLSRCAIEQSQVARD